MIVLFISSLNEYLSTSTVSQMLIDDSPSEEQLKISFIIEFPYVPCELIYMDIQDIIGFSAENLKDNFERNRIINGVVEKTIVEINERDITYENIKARIEQKEGCRIDGDVMINKVPGNMHFSMHSENLIRIAQKLNSEGYIVNYAHKIVRFGFGVNEKQTRVIQKRFPEIELTPLDGTSMKEDIRLPLAYQYYLNVVRTIVIFGSHPLELYQYTISKSFGITRDVPALFFKYEMSPLYVRYDLKQKSIWHFIVNICAIIGGVYTAFSILDAIIYSSVSKIFKSRIGKLS